MTKYTVTAEMAKQVIEEFDAAIGEIVVAIGLETPANKITIIHAIALYENERRDNAAFRAHVCAALDLPDSVTDAELFETMNGKLQWTV